MSALATSRRGRQLMADKRIALITGANQGVGYQVAKELVEAGNTVLLGSRDLARGEAAAKEIGPGATAIQIDVIDRASVEAAAKRIEWEFGRLDLLVNNAAISHVKKKDDTATLEEIVKRSRASNADIDEVKAIWETNVFGTLSVYQVMLPLLRKSSDARIVNVTSGVGSLATNASKEFHYRNFYGPGYSASKAAQNAVTLAMMIELEETDIKVNLVSPGFTKTNLNNYQGTESLEDGSREVVRVCLFGPEDPTGTYTRWNNETIPW
jgi:NAD(P)-dependent dehydrogenase (short-subunit alcohol dehydrogenase family)